MTKFRVRTHVQPGLYWDSTKLTVMGRPGLSQATLKQEKVSKHLPLNVHSVAHVT